MAKPEGSGPGGFLAALGAQAGSALVSTAGNLFGGRSGMKRQYKYWKKMADYQQDINRSNAEWALAKDMEMRKWQMDMDSPSSQMRRFKEAGLNPNLVYGQGTPGNMGTAPQVNAPAGPSMSSIDAGFMARLGSDFQQARLMAAQTDLTRTKDTESQFRSELIQAQKDVTKANPYLKAGYVESLVAQLKATADIKSQEAEFKLQEVAGYVGDKKYIKPTARGMIIMQEQMDQLMQKFNLNTADLKLKAEVLQSKEFQNALQQVQVEWMKNADITPQHIYQGIFMLLQSLMNKR